MKRLVGATTPGRLLDGWRCGIDEVGWPFGCSVNVRFTSRMRCCCCGGAIHGLTTTGWAFGSNLRVHHCRYSLYSYLRPMPSAGGGDGDSLLSEMS